MSTANEKSGGQPSRRERIANDWKTSDYYDRVEETVAQFWSESGHFRPMFNHLDLTSVLELACGRGRHVPQYINRAGSIVLVDVNEENISFCRSRFSDAKVKFIKNNGFDFSAVDDNSLTSIFSYDAMVHFELFDIFEYLKEARRTLKPGGYALFHHSNYTGGPENDYNKNPHWRNFMSASIMRYLASRAELEVIQQKVIDWGSRRKHFQHDCISLIRKPIGQSEEPSAA
ncbi:ubiquinone/menaquinone biosynthesis C-methylase UbiE [Sinorhizobium terangae]|nr:class I SAM-dependent methyltransferase [Sinorhizobium terangae]MBB4184213.1 ubiquinone/menaquinone biosynthesis C-methylase UbiE [Sinorhizobium terangae]